MSDQYQMPTANRRKKKTFRTQLKSIYSDGIRSWGHSMVLNCSDDLEWEKKKTVRSIDCDSLVINLRSSAANNAFLNRTRRPISLCFLTIFWIFTANTIVCSKIAKSINESTFRSVSFQDHFSFVNLIEIVSIDSILMSWLVQGVNELIVENMQKRQMKNIKVSLRSSFANQSSPRVVCEMRAVLFSIFATFSFALKLTIEICLATNAKMSCVLCLSFQHVFHVFCFAFFFVYSRTISVGLYSGNDRQKAFRLEKCIEANHLSSK